MTTPEDLATAFESTFGAPLSDRDYPWDGGVEGERDEGPVGEWEARDRQRKHDDDLERRWFG